MFFEGSEKKIEIIVNSGSQNLRELGDDFWALVVSCSHAEIISTIRNQDCTAYLLSESSLFVWDNRFLMITCGTTTLIHALLFFIEKYGQQHIAFTSFQRKNEYLSHLQKSDFEQDIAALRAQMPGKAYRMGHLDSHHHFIFHLDKPYQPEDDDTTSELLMYHIKGEAADYLRSSNQNATQIRALLKFEQLLPGFIIDDFVFEPFGYSMNAIKGNQYATMHITPQENSSYVSFETNIANSKPILESLLKTLNPGCWDLVGFNNQPLLNSFTETNCLSHCTLPLDCGYTMYFRYYQQPEHETLIAEAM
jgi:S-adenosylmethionine decarboxylase